MYAALILACVSAGFFDRPAIEFWGPRPPRPAKSPLPEPEGEIPGPAKRLLDAPSPATARAYLKWQKERIEQVRRALEMIRQVKR